MAESPSSTLDQLLSDLNWVRGLARQLAADPLQADDAVQEASLIAMRRARTGEALSRGWLATVVRNLLRRGHRNEQDREVREAKGARAEALPSAAELNSRMELQRVLAEAVSELPEPYRATLILRFLEEASVEEIAGAHGVVAATVRSRVSRGLALLRERLDRQSGGRENWLPGVVMLAGPSRVPEGVAASGATVGVLGGILMSKLPLSVFVLVLAALCWKGWARLKPEEPLAGTSALALSAADRGNGVEPGVGSLADSASDSARGAVAVDPVVLDDPMSSGGWWLTGQVLTGGSPADGPVEVAVVASFIGGLDRETLHRSDSAGRLEVDVSDLFTTEGRLVRELRVTCSSPGFMPTTATIKPTTQDRQGPLRGAGATRLPLHLDLPPVFSTVQGQLIPVDWGGALDLEVALLRVSESGNELVSRATAGSDGRYSLDTPFEGPHWVVAWLPSPVREPILRPRPGNLSLAVSQSGVLMVNGPEIRRGESVSGTVKFLREHAVQGATVELRLITPETYGVVSGAGRPIGFDANSRAPDLIWAGQGYEWLHASGVTGGDGHYVVSGLTGSPYLCSPLPFGKLDAERAGDSGRIDAAAEWITELDVSDVVEFLVKPSVSDLDFVTTSYSTPVEVVADAPLDVACTIRRVDEHGARAGRYSIRRNSREEPFRSTLKSEPSRSRSIEVSCPGFESQIVDLPDPSGGLDQTLRVVLIPEAVPDRTTSTLEIRLANDPDRVAEWAELRLWPLPRASRGYGESVSQVRVGDRFLFEGLRAGRYRATVRFMSVEDMQLDESFTREQFEVELPRGGRVVRSLEVEQGCRLVFERGALPDGASYRITILDAAGETVPIRLVSPQSKIGPAPWWDPSATARSETLLPAGRYRVRAVGEVGSWQASIVIPQGETELTVQFD